MRPPGIKRLFYNDPFQDIYALHVLHWGCQLDRASVSARCGKACRVNLLERSITLATRPHIATHHRVRVDLSSLVRLCTALITVHAGAWGEHQLPHAYSDCHIRHWCVMQTGHTITIALVSCATAVHRYHSLTNSYPGVRGHGLLYDTCTGPWYRHNTPNSGSAAVVHNLICNWEGVRSPLQCLIIAVGTQAVRCDAFGRRSWPRGEEKLEGPGVCHQLSHMPLQPRALH